MKMINRKNFLSTVCIVYTILSVFKIVIEGFIYKRIDSSYENFIWLLVNSVIATFVLSLHYYLRRFPVWLVIIGQYLALILFIGICIWLEGHFITLHPDAYRDMFVSFTIPYIICAVLYYVSFWYEVKKANAIIQDLKKNGKDNDNEKIKVSDSYRL